MLGRNMINLKESWARWVYGKYLPIVELRRVTFKYYREPERDSLIISWLGTGVSRMLRVNASNPTILWKGKHP
jgi:hypothetical protein